MRAVCILRGAAGLSQEKLDANGDRKEMLSLCIRLHRLVQRNDSARSDMLLSRTAGAFFSFGLVCLKKKAQPASRDSRC